MLMKLKQKKNKITWDKKLTTTDILDRLEAEVWAFIFIASVYKAPAPLQEVSSCRLLC